MKSPACTGQSAESAGTSHPASFLMLMAPQGAKPESTVLHDAEKNTWSVVLPLSLQVKGQAEPIIYPVQLVVVGAVVTVVVVPTGGGGVGGGGAGGPGGGDGGPTGKQTRLLISRA